MDVPSGEANPVAKSSVKGQGNARRLWKGQECVDAQTAEELGTHYGLLEPLRHSSELTGLDFLIVHGKLYGLLYLPPLFTCYKGCLLVYKRTLTIWLKMLKLYTTKTKN